MGNIQINLLFLGGATAEPASSPAAAATPTSSAQRGARALDLLGLAPAELARLGEEDSAEAEAEHELQLWGDEAGDE